MDSGLESHSTNVEGRRIESKTGQGLDATNQPQRLAHIQSGASRGAATRETGWMAGVVGPPTGREWAERWQRSWDELEGGLIGDREVRLAALIDVVLGVVGHGSSVVDLACGTGTVTRRLLEKSPSARSVAVDVDPVLLTIAEATFAEDDRVQIVRTDLRDPDWIQTLPAGRVDGVVTATALHWLPEAVVRRLYSDLAALVRPGGLVAHAEQMPLADLPRLTSGLARLDRERREASRPEMTWDEWWASAALDPLLRGPFELRRGVFETTYPAEEFSPPADWHVSALEDAGFAEVGVVWRSGAAAVVAAVR